MNWKASNHDGAPSERAMWARWRAFQNAQVQRLDKAANGWELVTADWAFRDGVVARLRRRAQRLQSFK